MPPIVETVAGATKKAGAIAGDSSETPGLPSALRFELSLGAFLIARRGHWARVENGPCCNHQCELEGIRRIVGRGTRDCSS
jgi:hypothetical protein